MTKLTKEQVIEIELNYQKKDGSIRKISNQMSISEKLVRKILVDRGIKLKTHTELSTKYTVDNNFFKNYQNWTQEQAYFLGWIMSDGHHNLKKHSISIRLQERDVKILQILKETIKYQGPVTFLRRKSINELIKKFTKTYQHRYSLTIVNNDISQDLTKLGIDNHKSESLIFPKYIKKEILGHFLRSFYDGDGTVCRSAHAGNKMLFDINLIAPREFCFTVQSILKSEMNIESRIVEAGIVKNGAIEVKFAGRLNALKFFNYVYKDARLVLKRKFRKFLALINFCKRQSKTEKGFKFHKEEFKHELSIAIDIAKDIIQNAQY